MTDLNLGYLCQAVKGKLINGQGETRFNGVTTNSRQVTPGQVYFALPGEKHDGHQYVGEAYDQGAVAAVIAREIGNDYNKPLIMVKDTVRALQSLASEYRSIFQIPVIAVTGSVGKTTTKDILARCLESSLVTLKTPGNFNNDIGLPLTLLGLEAKHQAAVVEMAMRSPGEIKRLAEVARPNAAVITNAEPVHLETMHTLENIARAKCEVLSVLSSRDFAVVNGDNKILVQAARQYDCIIYTFGYEKTCDFRILKVDAANREMQIRADFRGQEECIVFPLPAVKLAYNVIAALAVCFLLGQNMPRAIGSLENFKPGDNRLNITRLKAGGVIINDSYNANPLSMSAALETAGQLRGEGKFVAVLGDMYELGAYEEEGHLMVGRKAVDSGVDLLVTIGRKSLLIAQGARSKGMPPDKVFSFADRESAISFIKERLKQEDTLLVKASRGMELEKLIGELEL